MLKGEQATVYLFNVSGLIQLQYQVEHALRLHYRDVTELLLKGLKKLKKLNENDIDQQKKVGDAKKGESDNLKRTTSIF